MIARIALLALLATPALAQDFSAGSQAKSWDLYAEKPALFEATVVDPLCDLTGDCPANCSDGKRQLALLRSADQVMVLPLKNSQPVFSGAANELQPYCGKVVEVDGLMLVDPDVPLDNVFQIQLIREKGTTEWVKANRWTQDWQAANPGLTGKEPWFRRDPRVNAEIARDGYFGLGLEIDAAAIKALFE
jgi:hypothetical protein